MIKIICIGKIKEKYLTSMINDYCLRIKKYHKIETVELPEERTLENEAENILKCINDKSYLILLDIEGIKLSSEDFSKLIDRTFISKSEIVFVIGSSLGLHKCLRDRANSIVSFSNMTFPHGLFRAILLEQIYRAFKIMNNESYHK